MPSDPQILLCLDSRYLEHDRRKQEANAAGAQQPLLRRQWCECPGGVRNCVLLQALPGCVLSRVQCKPMPQDSALLNICDPNSTSTSMDLDLSLNNDGNSVQSDVPPNDLGLQHGTTYSVHDCQPIITHSYPRNSPLRRRSQRLSHDTASIVRSPIRSIRDTAAVTSRSTGSLT